MKLNADIIFSGLQENMELSRYGNPKHELLLERPELYDGITREFEENHVYVAFTSQLPANPILKGNVLVVCLGGVPPTAFYSHNNVCLILNQPSDLCTVFNKLQKIYNKYDAWDADLHTIIDESGNLQKIIDRSFEIFHNPMIVIGSDYYYIACSSVISECPELARLRPDKHNRVPIEMIHENLENAMTNQQTDSVVFVQNRQEGDSFFMNLFVRKVYAGTFRLFFILRRQRNGELELAQYLGTLLEQALFRYAMIGSGFNNQMGDLLIPILQGMPIETIKMRELGITFLSGPFLCIKILVDAHVRQIVAMEYLLRELEDCLPECAAFEYESAMVAFVNLEISGFTETQVYEKISAFLKGLHLIAGISNLCSNLSMARYYYRQASIALEFGAREEPEKCCHKFSDYMLYYMLFSCTGEFPLEFFLSDGFQKFLQYDESAHADYIKTLRAYLNNNMNISQTAKELFIHRSTLLERLKKINSFLDMDLMKADERLMLSIILRILEERDRSKEKSSRKRTASKAKHKTIDASFHKLDKL